MGQQKETYKILQQCQSWIIKIVASMFREMRNLKIYRQVTGHKSDANFH